MTEIAFCAADCMRETEHDIEYDPEGVIIEMVCTQCGCVHRPGEDEEL